MKLVGFGLIILMVAFALGAYALFVPWTIVQRAQAGGYAGTGALYINDFLNSLYNALQLGLLALILGVIGTLVFFVEFMRHAHTTYLAPLAPPMQPSPRFCKFCGDRLAEGENVCRKCGTVVSS
jgi:hypothetical protein